jgi:hypothetical protein
LLFPIISTEVRRELEYALPDNVSGLTIEAGRGNRLAALRAAIDWRADQTLACGRLRVPGRPPLSLAGCSAALDILRRELGHWATSRQD